MNVPPIYDFLTNIENEAAGQKAMYAWHHGLIGTRTLRSPLHRARLLRVSTKFRYSMGTRNSQFWFDSRSFYIALGHTSGHIIMVTRLVTAANSVPPPFSLFQLNRSCHIHPSENSKSRRAFRTIPLYEAAPSVNGPP
jgi:hypothetical protein